MNSQCIITQLRSYTQLHNSHVSFLATAVSKNATCKGEEETLCIAMAVKSERRTQMAVA